MFWNEPIYSSFHVSNSDFFFSIRNWNNLFHYSDNYFQTGFSWTSVWQPRFPIGPRQDQTGWDGRSGEDDTHSKAPGACSQTSNQPSPCGKQNITARQKGTRLVLILYFCFTVSFSNKIMWKTEVYILYMLAVCKYIILDGQYL